MTTVIATLALLSAIALGASTATPPKNGNYFTSDYETRVELEDANEKLNQEIVGEGITLLKNEDNALPLGQNAKISLFGKNSRAILKGGSGSGSGTGGTISYSLTDSLTRAGFSLNPTLISFYNNNSLSGSGRGTAPTNGNLSAGYNTGETPLASYSDEVKNSFADYADAAIVVISRIGGEGFDLPRTMKWNGSSYGSSGSDATQTVPGARSGDDHYLQLDQNEADLIQFCGVHFNKVIVLLNTGSQFECGFLDDPNNYAYHKNVKAALWIGYPGGTGILSLGKILNGEITPSGRTVDTYARDFKKDPTWMNFGNNLVEIDSSHKGNQYVNLPGAGGNGGGGYRNNYVDYKEGIYVGYRYYETRGFDEGTAAFTGEINGTTTTAWDNWYQAHVVYPFGYGLSYTSFKEEIVSADPVDSGSLAKSGKITLNVKVTNTGMASGKDTVELYYTAPYTEGGIEKSSVVLGAFEKTKLLQPGASETLTLDMMVQDMASYDFNDANNNGFKGYELDAGKYEIHIRKNAHEDIAKVTYDVTDNIQYDKDGTTDHDVKNRFDEISSSIDQYLSRSDWTGTYPTTDFRLSAPQWVIAGLKEWDAPAADKDNAMPYAAATMPTMDASNNLLLKDLVGLPYEDAKWASFLDQFSADQLRSLVTQGSYSSGINYPELGVVSCPNADGPAGFLYGAPSGNYVAWCCDTVLASTFNKELGQRKGEAMGNEALWGNGSNGSKICGWYAPACDMHRSPFGGRNFEYYSEDGMVSGLMASSVVLGAQNKGLFTYVKHFALNDQETNRCGLLTWANEQSMRELYFKPFEFCVKRGHSHGMMSSLNRIGPTWAGGDYALLTEVLRNEWGFQGCVVTDSFLGGDQSNPNQMIRAGGNLTLGGSSLSYNTNTATTLSVCREDVHGLLYAMANSIAMNTSATPTSPKPLASFDTKSLKTGVQNSDYDDNVATAHVNTELCPDGEDKDIVYTLAEGNTLPEGLTLSADGHITGVPSVALNSFPFSVKATYENYSKTASFAISIVSASGAIVYETNPALAEGTIGVAYSALVNGAHIYKPDATEEEISNYPPVTYALKDGSLLPEGLSLSSDGTLSGTPIKECDNYRFTISASALGYPSTSLTFTLSLKYSLAFEAKELKTARYGIAYVDQVKESTCVNSVIYSLKEGSSLPKGLTLTEEGYITGTPLACVTAQSFVVVASAPMSQSKEATYSITVGLTYNEVMLMDGKEGESYSGLVNTAQGAGDIAYTLKEGSALPEGLTLAEDGTLSGTPSKAGNYTFTILANAEGKSSDELTLSLYVANADRKPDQPANPDNTALIIGGTAGGIVVVAALTTALALVLRKKKQAPHEEEQ